MTDTPQNSDSDRLERIERLVERIANDQSEMKADMGVMQRDIATLQRDMGMMQRNIATLQRDMGVVQRDMGAMKGWQTELVVERRARVVFRRLCGGYLLRIYPDIELQHYIGYNRRSGAMSEDEFAKAGTIDFLLEGTDPDGTAVMYAVEVSFTAGIDDSNRAIEKSALLTRSLGREVRPAVVGEVSTAQFDADATSRNVAFAYIGDRRDIVR